MVQAVDTYIPIIITAFVLFLLVLEVEMKCLTCAQQEIRESNMALNQWKG